jgi:acyl-CoA synthetase (AMP-forming)/AMP-acid ligase II
MITFTTGDAEPPKGVPKTASYLEAQHRALTSCLGLAQTDVDLCTMPGFVMNDMAAGVPVVPVRSAAAPRLLADLLSRKGPAVSRITASPGVLDVLARFCLVRNRSFCNVQRVVTGGAAVQERFIANLYRVFPETTVTVLYGSTEAIPIAAIDGKEWLAECARETARGAGYCVGRPVDSIALRIQPLGAPGHTAAPPSTAEPGEIIVAGESVNPAYWNDEGATARTKLRAPDGIVWHRTMDTGYLDGSGRLWLTGKVKHLIRSGSDTIYPLRIEGALHAIPGVRRAAVFGAPATGAAVHAALCLDPRTRARLATEGARDAASRLGVALSTICVLARMPLDPRHHYKIDYDRLRRIRVVKARVRRAQARVDPKARRR